MELMTIFSWLLFGFIIGAVAAFVFSRTKNSASWIITGLVGMGGAFFGGYFGSVFGYTTAAGSWAMGSRVTAVAGALFLLLVYGAFFRNTTTRPRHNESTP